MKICRVKTKFLEVSFNNINVSINNINGVITIQDSEVNLLTIIILILT